MKNCKTTSIMFVKDLQIYVQSRPSELDPCIRLSSEKTQHVVDWPYDNVLYLNVAKTKAMVIGSHQQYMCLNLEKAALIIVDRVMIALTDVA